MRMTVSRAVRYILLGLCLLYVATALYIQHRTGATSAASFAQKEATKPPPTKKPEAKARELWWKTMRGFDFRKGTITDELKTYDGALVKIPGFMVPLEDDAYRVREFLLVPYMGACIHTPPPPPNQIVHVRMVQGKSVPVEWYSPIWVEGKLLITRQGSIYGDAAFVLTGVTTEAYREEER